MRGLLHETNRPAVTLVSWDTMLAATMLGIKNVFFALQVCLPTDA
jgi:hypothetical protein